MGEEIKYKINNAEYNGTFTLTTAQRSPDGAGKGLSLGEGDSAGVDSQAGPEINFSKSSIRGMDIEENYLEPFTNGNIYINNPLDFIEDGQLIRGDGRDKFTVKFEPVDDGEGTKDGKIPLEYNFVISGEVNSTGKTDRLNNFKVYRLLDRNYFLLSEQIPYGQRFKGKVGCIIQNILDQFGIPNQFQDIGDMEIDFLPEHVLPPSTFRYSDLLKYLLKLNYKREGKTYVRLFLNWCRRCKHYKYEKLSRPFIENVKRTREGFMVDDLIAKNGNSLVNENNASTAPGYTKTNLNVAALPNTDFSTPMLIYTNTYLNNILVLTYDPILGEHVMNEVRIKDVKKEWEKLFVKPFGYVGGMAQPWAVLNQVKTRKLFRNLGFNYPPDRMVKLAEAELTTNMVFFNLQIGFQTLGNTDRQPGEFMDVSVARDMIEEEGINPFGGQEVKHRSDVKLLGKWFITKIRHEFTTAKVDNYTNLIQCIKPHIGPGEPVPKDNLG
jgi:hypothetical protein